MKYCVFALFSCLIFWCSAQTGLVRGTVYGANNEPIFSAKIILKSDQLYGVITDIDGKFELHPSFGTYTLLCSNPGFKTDTLTILVADEKVVELAIKLVEITIEIEEVEIKVGKFDKPIADQTVSMEILKPRLIENKNTRSIETVLDQTPGLNILDGEPQIRGGSGFTFGVGSKVAVLVDDMPMLSGDAGRPEWGFIPVENISQVEVTKGAASVLSGSSALSGSINIRTAYPTNKPLTKVNVYSGLYSQPQNRAATWYTDLPLISGVNLLHSRKKGNWDIVVGGNFNYDHGYIGPGATDSLVWEDTITNFSAKQMVSQRGRINFNLARKSVRYKGLTVGINGNGMLAASNMVFAWLNDTSGIYRAYPGAAFLQKQVIFNLDPYAVYVKNGNKHALRTRMLRTVNDITANQGNQSTVFYGDYQFQTKLKQLFNIDFIGGISSQHTYSYASIYSGSGHPSNTMLNVSAYAQLERKLVENLTLSAGGRLEYFNLNNSVEKWKPIFRAGANYKLFQATFLRASYGQGYRFPTITERFIRTGVGNFGVFPNPNLKPESSWNAEIGIKQGFKIGPVMSYIDLAGFWQEYQNTIEYMFGIWRPLTTPEALASSAGFMFLNTGNSRVKGLDFSLAGTVKLSKKTDLTFLAGYNYILPTTLTPDYIYATDSLNRKFSFNTTSLNPDSKVLKYRFLHNAKMDVEFSRNKRLNIGFSAKYFSKIVNMDKIIKDFEVLTQGIDVLQDIRYMDYYYTHQHGIWVFDARIGYQLNTKHKLSIVGSNILNTTYSLRPLKVEQPRVIMLQYTYKLGGN